MWLSFQARLPVALSVTVRLRVLCHLSHRARQVYARGWRSGGGKADLLAPSPYTPFAGFDARTLGSPCGGTNSDRVQWTKQGAVSGAALRFLQAGTAPRRKKRLSARGAGAKRLRGESPAHNAWNEKNDGNESPKQAFRSHRSLSQNRSKRSGGQYTAQLTAPSRTGCCRVWRKSRFGPEARRGCPARRSCRPASPG